MFCSKCGHKLNDGDLFCSKCGNRVASTPDTPVTPDAPEKPETSETSGTPETPVAFVTPVTPSDEPVTPVAEPVTPVAEPVTPVAEQTVSVDEAASTEAPLENPETSTDMTPPPPEKSPDGKSRLAYQVLALSFGFLGLHNFYARRIAPACFQLLLTATAVALFLILKVCPIQDISEARAIQDISFLCFLPVVIWLFTEIFTVHKDGKGNPWGEDEDFASAPGIESIDAMVLAEFRTNKRRCIAGFFLSLILLFVIVIAACTGGGEVSTLGVAVFAVLGLLLPFLLVMSWYFHARSKGYAPGYSIVLALLGFLGMVMFVVGACFFVKNPLSLVMGGSAFLAGILLPIAASKVARRILLKNGFKALSSAKKALTVVAIVGSFVTVVAIVGSFVLAIAGVGFAVEAMKADDAARQFNRGVALMESGKFEDAAKAFRIAAEKGRADAQFNLGWCYANGKGVEKDLSEAVRWYRKAARQGFAMAEFNLGTCYATGRGIEKDIDEAVKWTRKAAEQGNDRAQFMLGVCYANGEGVEKDMAEAVRWYRKAAELGNADAQCSVGLCYYIGFGGEKDKDEGLKWIRKAASRGHPNAKALLKELGEPEE